MKLSELCTPRNAVGCRICDVGESEKAPQLVFIGNAGDADPAPGMPRNQQWNPDYDRWVIIFKCTSCGALRYNDLQSDFDDLRIEEK